jgi:hypothetical protein
VQAADFLIKEGRKLQQQKRVADKYADSPDEAEALFLSTKKEQQVA